MPTFIKKEIHLKNLIDETYVQKTTFDTKVEEFLAEAANDFILKTIQKARNMKKLQNREKDRTQLEDAILVKYSMKSIFNVDLGRKDIGELRKIKKNKTINKKRISLKMAENTEL